MTTHRTISTLCSALLLGVTTARTLAQYDLPTNQQDGTSDCGPAAAAAALKYLEENGFGELENDDGDSGVKDFESDLEAEAGTDENGTWIHNLRDAINELIGGTDHDGQLCAALPRSGTAYRGFGFLDGAIDDGCMILLLLIYKDEDDNDVNHYVAVRNITGEGDSRTVSYMDPATGTNKSGAMAVNDGDGKLHLQHDGNDARVGGILVICPKNGVASSASPVDQNDPDAGTNIEYTVRYPSTRPTRDLHVWVGDCDKDHYAVSGLPDGWQWDVHMVGGKCYLSIWKGGSDEEIPSGTTITVTYTGPNDARECRRVITPTTGGSMSPTDSARPAQDGHTVAFEPGENEVGPGALAMALSEVNAEEATAVMTWPPVPDLGAGHYEIYDVNTGYLLAETTDTSLVVSGLEHDGAHEFVVAARYESMTLSPDSASASMLFDLGGILDVSLGEATYVPSSYSSDAPRPWQLAVPGGEDGGQMAIATHTGELLPPPPPTAGPRHHEAFSLWTTFAPNGPIFIGLPYDAWQVQGGEHDLRLLAVMPDQQWQDVTQFVDPETNMIFGQLPGPTVLAVFNGALPPCPPDTNGDGAIDVDDLVNVILCWGTSGANCPEPGIFTDVNGDGVVGVDDLIAIILAFDGSCGDTGGDGS